MLESGPVPAGRAAPRRIAWAAVGAGALFNLGPWLVPQLEQGAIEHLKTSAAMAGTIATAEASVAGLLSIALARWAGGTLLRSATFGALILWFAANLATASANTAGTLLLLRIFAGAGTGMLTYIASTLATHTPTPDRTFGQMAAAGNAFAAAVVMAFPWLMSRADSLAIFPVAALVSILWLPLLLAQPARLQVAPAVSPTGGRTRVAASAKALMFAVLCFAVMNISNFTFSIPLGLRAGLADADVQVALGASAVLGTFGAMSASLLPHRAGHFLPLLAALLVVLGSNLVLTAAPSPWAFRISVCAIQMFGLFFFPVALGWSATIDPSGRAAALMNGTVILAGALCPGLTGLVIDRFSVSALPLQSLLTGGGCMLGLFLTRMLMRSGDRPP